MKLIKIIGHLPVLMKNGILKRPDKTRSRNDWSVDPSNGSAPHTSTYRTTPSDCMSRDKENVSGCHRVVKEDGNGG